MTTTTRPCGIFTCCAYAVFDSEFCPVHRDLHAKRRLDIYPTKVVVRRSPRPTDHDQAPVEHVGHKERVAKQEER